MLAAMPASPASWLSHTMRDVLSIVGKLFIILQTVFAGLAFLVAFNASNIGAEERVRELPDLAVLEFLSTPSYLLTVAMGLAAAAAAPWLNVRRLRAMNLPSTLRFVE